MLYYKDRLEFPEGWDGVDIFCNNTYLPHYQSRLF